ncbi:phytanoyl-CoA dioxygenase [Rhizobium freirei PRF 81]|uniref:Phytanoyl-CoA dioxygenase n=1 Tax=Rhizobium freirei PRF 81 TaxID=363754 RepID=N6UTU3_9HYPH|nr:phytanoyl-CoA dioxygenase family protein [Rhizobium freirei]ENN84226.1 phytanoyl-CoA dioxygenase [Rhizobium freirei PRF 81]
METVKTYGITNASSATGRAAAICEEIAVRGFGVLESVLPMSKVASLNQKLEDVYAAQCAEVSGEEALEKLNDRDIVRCPLAYDREFLELATSAELLEIPRLVLGEGIQLLMQNGVINRPERVQAQTGWHRDLNYQHWVSSKPLAVSALVCLEDFNLETGGTAFLPSSHKFEAFPSEQLVALSQYVPSAPAGSILFFDAMTFHRAGINKSSRIRRAINHVIGVPILAQQISIPSMLSEAPEDPAIRSYLGYRWLPSPSVKAWRQAKLSSSK